MVLSLRESRLLVRADGEGRIILEKIVGPKQEGRQGSAWEWVSLRSRTLEAGWAQGSLWSDQEPFLTGGEELEVVERGCTHPEKTNRTMSYRIGMQVITLTETVCGSDLCNKPHRGE